MRPGLAWLRKGCHYPPKRKLRSDNLQAKLSLEVSNAEVVVGPGPTSPISWGPPLVDVLVSAVISF